MKGLVWDANVHVTPGGSWFATQHIASEDRLLREMDEVGVSGAAVVGLPDYIPNHFVLQVCGRHPDRLIPVASFNPMKYSDERGVRAGARDELKDHGFVGVKLHPRLNRYDPLNSHVLTLLEEMALWNKPLPVWLCTFLYYRGGTLRKPVVDTLWDLVSSFPSTRFVLLHGAGPDLLRTAHAIRDCPNAFLDLSYTLSMYRGSSVESDIRYLVRTFEQRLLFGSDFPEVSLGKAHADFMSISDGAADAARHCILSGNLARLIAG